MKVKIRPVKPIPFTKIGYDKLVDEKRKFIQERPTAVAELKRAREMGDLSENGAYKGARFKLSHIDRKIRELDHLIKYAQIVQSTQSDVVEIGSTVTISSEALEQTFTIVGSFESNPGNGTISHKSPLGQALLGKKQGDIVVVETPGGNKQYIVSRISVSPEEVS